MGSQQWNFKLFGNNTQAMEDISKEGCYRNKGTKVRLSNSIQGLPELEGGGFTGEETGKSQAEEEDLESRLSMNLNLQALGSHGRFLSIRTNCTSSTFCTYCISFRL